MTEIYKFCRTLVKIRNKIKLTVCKQVQKQVAQACDESGQFQLVFELRSIWLNPYICIDSCAEIFNIDECPGLQLQISHPLASIDCQIPDLSTSGHHKTGRGGKKTGMLKLKPGDGPDTSVFTRKKQTTCTGKCLFYTSSCESIYS